MILACLVAVWARTMLLVRQCVWRNSPLMCCYIPGSAVLSALLVLRGHDLHDC